MTNSSSPALDRLHLLTNCVAALLQPTSQPQPAHNSRPAHCCATGISSFTAVGQHQHTDAQQGSLHPCESVTHVQLVNCQTTTGQTARTRLGLFASMRSARLAVGCTFTVQLWGGTATWHVTDAPNCQVATTSAYQHAHCCLYTPYTHATLPALSPHTATIQGSSRRYAASLSHGNVKHCLTTSCTCWGLALQAAAMPTHCQYLLHLTTNRETHRAQSDHAQQPASNLHLNTRRCLQIAYTQHKSRPCPETQRMRCLVPAPPLMITARS